MESSVISATFGGSGLRRADVPDAATVSALLETSRCGVAKMRSASGRHTLAVHVAAAAVVNDHAVPGLRSLGRRADRLEGGRRGAGA